MANSSYRKTPICATYPYAAMSIDRAKNECSSGLLEGTEKLSLDLRITLLSETTLTSAARIAIPSPVASPRVLRLAHFPAL